MFFPKCGQQTEENSKFCQNFGEALSKDMDRKAEKIVEQKTSKEKREIAISVSHVAFYSHDRERPQLAAYHILGSFHHWGSFQHSSLATKLSR